MSTRIEVVTAADQAVGLPLGVLASAIRSVSDADGPVRLSVFVAAGSTMSIDDAKRAGGDKLQVERVEVPSSLSRGIASRDHLPMAAYYRLFAAELLDASRVLHLDTDTLPMTSLRSLWDMDLIGHAIAAVQNPMIPYIGSRNGVQCWQSLGLNPRLPYFNSGVLIMDLASWRRDRHAEGVLEVVRRGSELFADQGPLNVHFAGEWTPLPLRWNQHPAIYAEGMGLETIFDVRELEEARSDPAIVHFVGPRKPWHSGYQHPYVEAWRRIARQIHGSEWAPVREGVLPVIKRRVAKVINAALRG